MALTQAQRDSLKVGDQVRVQEYNNPEDPPCQPAFIGQVVYVDRHSVTLQAGDQTFTFELDNPWLSMVDAEDHFTSSVNSEVESYGEVAERCGVREGWFTLSDGQTLEVTTDEGGFFVIQGDWQRVIQKYGFGGPDGCTPLWTPARWWKDARPATEAEILAAKARTEIAKETGA